MRPSFPAALSCAAACALFVTAGVAFQAAPQAPPPAGSQSSAPAAPTAPAQFPPLGTGVSPEERATLQSAVDQLATRVTALKVKYRSGAMADRVADVEIYLDAVRRPLKYDERLYAPKGSAPAADSAADARNRHRTRGAIGSRHDAVDDRQRRSRVLFEDRRLRAAIHPHDARQLRRRRPSGNTGSTSSCTAATTPCSSSSS